MYSTRCWTVSLHSLKVCWQEVACRNHTAQVAHAVHAARPDDPPLDDATWQHGSITHVTLPKDEDDNSNCSTDEQSDDGGAIPSVGIPGSEL
jgi:hypothetical protein